MSTPRFELSLEQETLDELVAAFAPRVGDGVVFLPGLDEPPLGARVVVDVKLKGGDVALSFEGLVSWRVPARAVPPGREAGVGLLVDAASDEHRALLERMRAVEGAGARARLPGATLAAQATEPGGLREARVPRAALDEGTSSPAGRRGDDDAHAGGFAPRAAGDVLASYERGLHRDPQGTRVPRPLPSPIGFPNGEERPPRLSGVYFAYEYDQRRPVSVKFLERFSWPDVGSLRPSKDDMRTWPADGHPPDDRHPSPWDDVTDGERRREVSDPGRRVTDVVQGAVDDVADVERALDASSSRQPPPLVRDSDDAEVTETDAAALPTDSGEPPAGTLPVALRVRIDDGLVDELFPRTTALPTSRTLFVSGGTRAQSVKVAVFEGDGEGQGRHLGSVQVRLPKGEPSVEVRFDVGADGWLSLRAPDDASVQERWRTSSAPPVEYPRGRRRPWWSRLFRG